MELKTDITTKAPDEQRVVGTRPIRQDGIDKVTGRARYGADINMAGLLHGKVLRSPHTHARIRSIDTSRAEALPGVRAVATSADFPIIRQELDFADGDRVIAENSLAHKKALYQGHAVAAVAATSPHIAEEAAQLIDVDYDVLPTVLTVHDALKDGAPVLHEGLTTFFTVDRSARGDDTGIRGNVASHIQLKRGDLEQGFRVAEVIVEREFSTQAVHQGYLEPFACTVDWSVDRHMTIWTSTQGYFSVRSTTAAIVGIPESTVKVIPMEVGGGFGGKGVCYLEPVAAVLSKKSGQPVKMVMSRKEVFEGTGPASGTHIRCKIGVDKAGRITAAQLYLAFEAGAYPGSAVAGGAYTGLGAYKVDNLLIDGYDVVCNKQKTQAYRAPGHPQAAFAVETVIDELAEKLDMNPMDLRLANAVHEGDRAPSGLPHARFGCADVEEAMKAHPHHSAPLGGVNRGRGIAVGYRLNGSGSGSAATINVNPDGTVNLITGSADLSGSRVAIAMQAAEVLGIAAEDVSPVLADTDSVGYSGTSGGSRITFETGAAAIATAEEVVRQMSARAAMLWEVQPEDVAFDDGVFVCKKDPADRIPFKELAGRLKETGGLISCSVSDQFTGCGAQLAGNILDVEVDPDTGKVEILRCTTFLDAGRAIHPGYVEGQMQGGALQGIGWALNEEYYFTDDGAMANSTLLDYRMPTTLDLPMIDTVIVEVPNANHPFGLRGVGEAPIVPPLAAVANAIYHAVGVRMDRLPMSPGAVLEALKARSDSH